MENTLEKLAHISLKLRSKEKEHIEGIRQQVINQNQLSSKAEDFLIELLDIINKD